MSLFNRTTALCAIVFLGVGISSAATLTGSFSSVPLGSDVNLTAEGKLDWVHWGWANETSLSRKATVIPQISDFVVVYEVYTIAYQQTDSLSSVSWADGFQVAAETNTITGVCVFSPANPRQQTNGFRFTVPADDTLKTLKVHLGANGAQGRFEAWLSDATNSYSDTSLNNATGGPGGVYTVNFAANSSNQTLTIRWTVFDKNNKDANVTLQAATLSAAGANNPPFAKITSPAMNDVFAAPANLTIAAEAFDPDGSIARVEFYANGILIGESTNLPFSLSVNNLPPGHYQITAIPVDESEAKSSSRPIDIFVHSSGGTLDGSIAVPPAGVDLTAEGTLDWVHWGMATPTNVNRKLGVPPRIAMTTLGTNVLQRYVDNYSGYSWSDGIPAASANGTQTGVFLPGITNGFQLSVRADTALKTLKVYVGLYGGSGNFQAWLSDFSAPAFTDRSLTNDWGNSYAVYTLNYAAASLGQTLNIRYTADSLFDQDYGNVTLQAATLSGTALLSLLNSQADSGNFTFSFTADLGRIYTVQFTDSFDPIDWQTLTNIIGSAMDETVTDDGNHAQRFYRIQTP